MSDGTGSFIIIMAAALLFFRPHDVPHIARNAGRAVGLSIRSMRKARDYGDDLLKHASHLASSPSSAAANAPPGGSASAAGAGTHTDLSDVKTQLQSSVSQWSTLATAVRRDLADVPLSPASFLRSRLRSAVAPPQSTAAPPPAAVDANPRAHVSNVSTRLQSVPASSSSPPPSHNAAPPQRASLRFTARSSAGADFISRSIEEAALAAQQRKWTRNDQPPDSTSK